MNKNNLFPQSPYGLRHAALTPIPNPQSQYGLRHAYANANPQSQIANPNMAYATLTLTPIPNPQSPIPSITFVFPVICGKRL